MSDTPIRFVYDGQCPLCQMGARHFRIRKAVGTLELIDARTMAADDPLKQQIDARGMDLDKGMVIAYAGKLYHGPDALHLMAMIGSDSGWLNRMNAMLFKSPAVARFMYPAFRLGRNVALVAKGVPQMNRE